MAWSETTKAKSDQLNADDLISESVTIKVTGVKVNMGDAQSGIISYEGDNGKPFKPCKSMRRVIEMKWGSDEKQFIGKSMTLVRDATVKWAGEEVGGIRISHMTDMKEDDRFMLTFSRNSKRSYKVDHLIVKDEKPKFISVDQVSIVQELVADAGMELQEFCEKIKVSSLSEIPESALQNILNKLDVKIKGQKND